MSSRRSGVSDHPTNDPQAEAGPAPNDAVHGSLAPPPDRRTFTTMSGVPVAPVYGDGPLPGEYPYTRGLYPEMYRGRLWTMRMFAGFGTAVDTNGRFQDILRNGGTGLSTAFDMPTLMGRDSDDEVWSAGEVGRAGVAIDTLADMEDLFAEIDLAAVSTSMTINGPAIVALAQYIAVGDRNGVERSSLSGTIQNDILKEYQAQKEYIYPPRPSMRIVTDMMRFTTAQMPRWHPVSISGYHIREAGSTAAQELGFTLANGFAYVEAAQAAGLDVDDFAGRLSFFFNSHSDFFEEVGKFRAARRIWATWMKERYGATSKRSLLCRFHTQTAGVSLTAQQQEINIARVALQALAAALGGTQSLHTDGFDEALALPTEKAARVALRTQQIVAHETGVRQRRRPAGRVPLRRMDDRRNGAPRHRDPRPSARTRRRLDPRGCLRGDRQRLDRGRDRRLRLPLRTRSQQRHPHHRRRQRIHRRRRRGRQPAAHRAGHRGLAAQTARGGEAGPRRRSSEAHAASRESLRRGLEHQPHAAGDRRSQGLRHRG